MAYTTVTKVKALFRNFTSNSSNQAVTDSTISDWIAEVDARINSRIGRFYQMPITGEESLLILQKISNLMVACQMDNTLNTYTDAQKKPEYCKQGSALLDEYAPMPKDGKIVEPISRLPDAIYTGVVSSTRRMSASVTNVAPKFQKGVDSW